MATSTLNLTTRQLMLEWTGDGEPEHVSQQVILEGSAGSWFCIECPPPHAPSTSELVTIRPNSCH